MMYAEPKISATHINFQHCTRAASPCKSGPDQQRTMNFHIEPVIAGVFPVAIPFLHLNVLLFFHEEAEQRRCVVFEIRRLLEVACRSKTAENVGASLEAGHLEAYLAPQLGKGQAGETWLAVDLQQDLPLLACTNTRS